MGYIAQAVNFASMVQPSLPADAIPFFGPETAEDAALSALARLTQHAKALSHNAAFTSRVKEQNSLVLARLGAAAGLFIALRGKHPPTASHSLRVALLCSAWGELLGLDREDQECLEIAALLHDIGKIGVPDAVLFKPRSLGAEERRVMDQKHACATEILLHCGVKEQVLRTMLHAGLWYGRHIEGAPCGDEIPLPGRMLCIVDAFDSMTNDQVFRRAMPVEQALSELQRCAGLQFDPNLVRQFQLSNLADQASWHQKAASKWLQDLRNPAALGRPSVHPAAGSGTDFRELFFAQLVDSSTDGVFFVRADRSISYWNSALERITGVKKEDVQSCEWLPQVLEMADQKGRRFRLQNCPILTTMAAGASLRLLVSLKGLARRVPVRLDIRAVTNLRKEVVGAAVQVHDLSGEAVLQEQYEDMRQKASRDPLTNLNNRAEMDRQHKLLFSKYKEAEQEYSLIICDIDRFKRINDTFGHHAGDEAIRVFGRILANHSDEADCVARYGGEEFVILCPLCDEVQAIRRAEQIRQFLAEQPLAALGGSSITASFGVAGLLPGDTPDTMLRRADRALLKAKDTGRNRVVAFGRDEGVEQAAQTSWFQTRTEVAEPELTWHWRLVARTPSDVLVGKIRGFVADHRAEIHEVRENFVRLVLHMEKDGESRRFLDRRLSLQIALELPEHDSKNMAGQEIELTIQPLRSKDRRRADLTELVHRVYQSLKSYLVAEDARPQIS